MFLQTRTFKGFANGRRSDVMTSHALNWNGWLLSIMKHLVTCAAKRTSTSVFSMVTLPSWASLLTHGNVKEGFVNRFVVDSNVDKVLELHGQACLIVERWLLEFIIILIVILSTRVHIYCHLAGVCYKNRHGTYTYYLHTLYSCVVKYNCDAVVFSVYWFLQFDVIFALHGYDCSCVSLVI